MERQTVETLTEDNYPPLAVQPLTSQELRVKAHWARFLPKLTADLTASGELDLSIRKLVHRTEFEIAVMEVKTGLSRAEIAPMFQSQLFPPPESESATPDMP